MESLVGTDLSWQGNVSEKIARMAAGSALKLTLAIGIFGGGPLVAGGVLAAYNAPGQYYSPDLARTATALEQMGTEVCELGALGVAGCLACSATLWPKPQAQTLQEEAPQLVSPNLASQIE